MHHDVETVKMSPREWGMFVLEYVKVIAVCAMIGLWGWGSAQLGSLLNVPGIVVAMLIAAAVIILIVLATRTIRRR